MLARWDRATAILVSLIIVFVYLYTWCHMTLGRCPLSIFCSRGTFVEPTNPESIIDCSELFSVQSLLHGLNLGESARDLQPRALGRWDRAPAILVQGYLAHKKPPPPLRNIILPYAYATVGS